MATETRGKAKIAKMRDLGTAGEIKERCGGLAQARVTATIGLEMSVAEALNASDFLLKLLGWLRLLCNETANTILRSASGALCKAALDEAEHDLDLREHMIGGTDAEDDLGRME